MGNGRFHLRPKPPSANRQNHLFLRTGPRQLNWIWYHFSAGWSSPVAREAHNLEVTGSSPVPAKLFGCKELQSGADP